METQELKISLKMGKDYERVKVEKTHLADLNNTLKNELSVLKDSFGDRLEKQI